MKDLSQKVNAEKNLMEILLSASLPWYGCNCILCSCLSFSLGFQVHQLQQDHDPVVGHSQQCTVAFYRFATIIIKLLSFFSKLTIAKVLIHFRCSYISFHIAGKHERLSFSTFLNSKRK